MHGIDCSKTHYIVSATQ